MEKFAPTGKIFMKFGIEYISKICLENSSFTNIWQDQQVFYMKTNIYLWSNRVQFFLQWEMFQKNVVEKSKHTFCVQ